VERVRVVCGRGGLFHPNVADGQLGESQEPKMRSGRWRGPGLLGTPVTAANQGIMDLGTQARIREG
jgi:hypothetical protein